MQDLDWFLVPSIAEDILATTSDLSKFYHFGGHLKKFYAVNKMLYMAFVDLEKTFMMMVMTTMTCLF